MIIKAHRFTCWCHLADQLRLCLLRTHRNTCFPLESEAPRSARLHWPIRQGVQRALPMKSTTKCHQIVRFPQRISFRLILAHNWGQFLSNFSCDDLQRVKFSCNVLQKSLEGPSCFYLVDRASARRLKAFS